MTDTKASNSEASPSITLTDEALASLPVYMSMVREPQRPVELEAVLDTVALTLTSQT